MPSLDKYSPSEFVKLILIGVPMSGKTGALTSLVKAGYHLRILDYDAKLTTLVAYVKKECPDRLASIEARTLRDQYVATANGPQILGAPRAYSDGLKMLDKWFYEESGQKIDLGAPASWGPDCVLVLDSLTLFARSAYNWAMTLVPRGKSGDYDGRAVYGLAMDAIRDNIMLLTSKDFRTNVIVTAHIDYESMPDGKLKGFPTTIGSKLSPNIPAMFPAMALVKTDGKARTIETLSTNLIDLANPMPFTMPQTLPIDTGLATFFQTIHGKKPEVKK